MLDWTAFAVAVAALFVADFASARRRSNLRPVRAAWVWSGIWISAALLFGAWIALRLGGEAGLTYLTAYVLEKSLSVDNLMLFALAFSETGIPERLQRRTLFWGVLGALVMRAVLIALGLYLLQRFHWVIYPLAVLLFYGGIRMLRGEESEQRFVEGTCALCTTWVARFVPITPTLENERFFVRKAGRLYATPLLVALAVIETADIVFAVDSIPAVFAVTQDPFLVYTSNIFALLGLRSLYAVLADLIRRFRYLRIALAVLLFLVAAKMALSGLIDVSPAVSLATIAAIFAGAVLASAARAAPAK